MCWYLFQVERFQFSGLYHRRFTRLIHPLDACRQCDSSWTSSLPCCWNSWRECSIICWIKCLIICLMIFYGINISQAISLEISKVIYYAHAIYFIICWLFRIHVQRALSFDLSFIHAWFLDIKYSAPSGWKARCRQLSHVTLNLCIFSPAHLYGYLVLLWISLLP